MSDDIFNPSGEKTQKDPVVPGLKLEYKIPHELVKLPSKGKFYPKDHILHGEEFVEVKSPGAREENILYSPALIKKGEALTELMRSCLINKAIDPDDFLVGDKNAVLIHLRILAFTEKYNVLIPCTNTKCGEKFPWTFDLRNLEIKESNADLLDEEGYLNFVLPVSKFKVRFSLLTEGQNKKINIAQEQRKKALQKRKIISDVDTKITDKFKECIKSINGIEDARQIAHFIDNDMPMQDSKELRLHMANIEPKVEFSQEAQCGMCGEVDVYDIPINKEFFWPGRD